MKKIIIIGGGIAGLTAGIYAQKSGFDSVIYEKHTIAGGECTGWNRKGFHIDGCIHWLTGTNEGTGVNKIWHETGGLDNTEIFQADNFLTLEYQDSKIILYRDKDKLKKHLLELSPEDKQEIENLIGYIEAFYNFEPPTEKPMDLMSLGEMMKFLSSMKRVMPVMKVLGKITLKEYLDKFRSKLIRKAFESIIPELNYSAYTLIFSLATFMSGNGGRPKGGSIAFAKRIEQKYLSLGGKIVTGEEVAKIIIENKVATGIQLKDNSVIKGDYIVPACDTNIILNKLLEAKYPDKKLDLRYLDEANYPLMSCCYVSFGIDADLSSLPKDFVFDTQSFDYENGKEHFISLKHYCYEPDFAPKGKSIAIVYIDASYDWWKEKHKNKDEYKKEKKRISDELIERIEQKLPHLANKITLLDFATPLTYERYCGAYKGAWMSFGTTPKSKNLMHNGKIKEVKNVYMAGQWLMPPGGLPTAAVTGKWAIQRICKKEKIEFNKGNK